MKSYGENFEKWRNAARPEWDSSVRHPFVIKLANDSLSDAHYGHYLAQCYAYLTHLSRAWGLTIIKADAVDEVYDTAAQFAARLDLDQKWMLQQCAERGMSEEFLRLIPEHPRSMIYTRYIMDVVFNGDFLDALIAIAPSVLMTGHAATQYKAPSMDPRFGHWLTRYSRPDYQNLCHAFGTLLDRAVKFRLGYVPEKDDRWPDLCEQFRVATELKRGIWDTATDKFGLVGHRYMHGSTLFQTGSGNSEQSRFNGLRERIW